MNGIFGTGYLGRTEGIVSSQMKLLTCSFKGTLDRSNQWHGTLWGCTSARQAAGRYEQLLQLIAEDVVPTWLKRNEPCVVKRCATATNS
jgi:hypothetical protein